MQLASDAGETQLHLVPGLDMLAGERVDPGALPAEDLHAVSVRVVAGVDGPKGLHEEVLLEHRMHPYESLEHRFRLSFQAMDWPGIDALDPFETNEPGFEARLRSSLLAQSEWRPVLEVGGELVRQASIRTDGRVDRDPATQPTERKWKGAASILGALDSTPSAGGEEEWVSSHLEIEIHGPGFDTRVERRTHFDLRATGSDSFEAQDPSIDPNEARALRRALALMGRVDLFAQAHDLSPGFGQALKLRDLANGAGGVAAALSTLANPAESQAAPSEVFAGLGDADKSNDALYALAYARRSAFPDTAAVYLDRPNVFALHLEPIPAPGGGAFLRRSYDIVENRVGVLGLEGSEAGRPDPERARRIRLLQGVADTAAESVLLDATASAGAAAESLDGVSDRMRSTNGAGWETWTTGNEAVEERLEANRVAEVDRERIRASLRSGATVVFAGHGPLGNAAADPALWWRIAPDGSTLGLTSGGRGGDGVVGYLINVGLVALAVASAVLVFFTCYSVDGDAGNHTKLAACGVCSLFAFVAALLVLFLFPPAWVPGAAVSATTVLDSLLLAYMGLMETVCFVIATQA